MPNDQWYRIGIEETMKKLNTSIEGLDREEAERRLTQYGFNELKEVKKKSSIMLFLDQFKNYLMLILMVAVVASAIISEYIDALVILIIMIMCVTLGFVQEHRAEKAMEALKRLAAPKARVRRSGEEIEIPAREIVPGDVVLLKTGDRIPADARVVLSMNLKVNEASLTGESVPVEKSVEALSGEKIGVAERANMVYMSTTVIYGRGEAVVTATGMNTEFGRIAEMIQTAEEPPTPLEKRLEYIGKWLGLICVVVCAVVVLLGIFRGQPPLQLFILGVALAVAAVPEALPAVVTVSLAIGVRRMAKRNAIVRRLPAVETLGCTTVICSDKTGTLTRDEMNVRKIYVNRKFYQVTGEGYEPKGEFRIANAVIDPRKDCEIKLLLNISALCNDAQLRQEENNWRIIGDPTEGALITVAAKAGIWRNEIEKENPRIGECPFSSERKRMTTIHSMQQKGRIAYTKGAPEIILEISSFIYEDGKELKLDEERRKEILEINHKMAGEGLRVLGMAYRTLPDDFSDFTPEKVEQNLVFVGLVGMIDAPREEAKKAIEICHQSGIKVVMITGDHQLTATAVAKELGLLKSGKVLTGTDLDALSDEELEKMVEEVTVYARVSPEHKLRIVKALKNRGHIVAMTGDGINDAPALKSADIGVAMGITGTDVTKESSSIVLADDNFASIVAAVEEGRGIYDNVKKYLVYLLSCNIGEILVFLVAGLLFLPLPLTAIQILWVNIATDGLPALALGVDPIDPNVMKRPPRDPREGVFSGIKGLMIMTSVILTIGLLSVFVWMLGWEELSKAECSAFVIMVLFELFFVFSCRSLTFPTRKVGFFTNKWLVIAVISQVAILAILVYLPFFNPIFNTFPLTPFDWMVIAAVASTGLIAAEVKKTVHLKYSSKKRK